MKTVYKLEGLDIRVVSMPSHFTSKIEVAVSKLDGVEKVNVSFLTTKLTLELDETKEDIIFDSIVKVVKKIESDVKVKKA